MKQKIVQIDAFTDKKYSGNPAAVCYMDEPADAKWMQAVALEMNLSETAFFYPEGDGYNLRWFTPACEVDLCGHATLASAFFLYSEKILSRDRKAVFHTKSGILKAWSDGDFIVLDFPALVTDQCDAPEKLIKALKITPDFVGKSKFDYLIEIASVDKLKKLKPDFALLLDTGARGIIVTAAGDGKFDFVSRFFAPAAGVNEDPVTGSAHCVLGPYWKNRLNKKKMMAYQASQRGGSIRVEVSGDRVYLAGKAVITLRGELV